MTGVALIVVFVIAIIAMILAISKYKVHPFLSIMAVSLVFGLIAGIPLTKVIHADGSVTQGIADVIGAGFSGIFTSIGIVIIFGALIGTMLEATGAAFKLADMVIKLVGKKRPTLAMMVMGWVVSVPVFCDSGFVILNPIRKALVKRIGSSSVAATVALSSGLYASHVLIPPTPGPLGAANILGLGDNLLLVMGMGALVSIPALIGSYFYAAFIGKRLKTSEEADAAELIKSYDEIVAEFGKLPNGFMALSPIVVPILLMALGSVSSIAGWPEQIAAICGFLGSPIIALAVGVIFGVIGLYAAGKGETFNKLTNDTLKFVGPILFITGAGGVLGRIIASTDMVPFITNNSDALRNMGLFFPFIVAAILKTAQGSSTVAIITTAGIMAPLMGALGYTSPVMAALVVMAVGAGSMVVSHANDSYYWVVTNLSGMTPEQGYKSHTMITLIEGLCAMGGIFILGMIFG